jgi:hypothetical protein
MTAHEILGFMSSGLSAQILDDLFVEDKPLYKAILAAVANAKRVRPVFMEKLSRAQRHPEMIAILSRASQDEVAGNLLRGWLLKRQLAVVTDFLDGLGIKHDKGVVEDLPESVDDAALKNTVEALLAKHPQEVVAVYLLSFYSMNDVQWPNLGALLKEDARLQLAG